jgi:hypothetical protein
VVEARVPAMARFRAAVRKSLLIKEALREVAALRLLSLWSSDQPRSAKRLHAGNWSWKQLRRRTTPPMRYVASSLSFIVISLATRLHRENSS